MSATPAVGPQVPGAQGPTRWAPGPPRPRLGPGELHVWRADLAEIGDVVVASLSAAERERALRIAGEDARRVWRRSRGLLRELLARYLHQNAGAIELAVDQRGKPRLADARQALFFNLSHSRELALYAFTTVGSVGVDVEVTREQGTRAAEDRVRLARRTFGDADARRLEGLKPAAREREFLRLWTRHEAELKRRGTGIGAATADEQTDGEALADPWIVELDLGAAAVAALAAECGPGLDLRLWEWA